MSEELDYEVPMEEGYQQQAEGVFHAGPAQRKKGVVTMLNEMVQRLNFEKGNLLGQIAGYKKLQNDYAKLYRDYVELTVAFDSAKSAWAKKENEYAQSIKGFKEKRIDDIDVLHMAITKYPDITNMYIKVRMEGKRKSLEGQIAKIQAEIDALPL